MSRFWIGIGFVALGLLMWASNMGWLGLSWSRDWPWLLVILGLWFLTSWVSGLVKGAARKSKRSKLERIVRDLEKGKISVEEAIKRIRREE